jgi:hypothetical protein
MPKKYEGVIRRVTSNGEIVKLKDLKPGESITVTTVENGMKSVLYTVYRPSRRKDESPIQYYKRTGGVDDRYYFRHKGRYYCNPAHCKRSWTNKKLRDEHLDCAYGALM